MAEPYLIRKYSSRRLYDVAGGRFLTLDDIYRLVREGRRVQAVDAAGKDITRSILLQVLAEREESEHPLLSAEVLHELMQLYGHGMQSLFERFLAEGLSSLLRQQDLWRDGLRAAMNQGSAAAMQELLAQQTQLWKASQDLLFGGSPAATAPRTGARRKPAPPPKPEPATRAKTRRSPRK